jgi:hypothetical protein
MIDWPRDLLPEHLWIAAMLKAVGSSRANVLYHATLDALDSVCSETPIPTGLITDFGLVPPESRQMFLEKHEELLREAFVEPIGRLVAYFPDCPARWMVTDAQLAESGPLDPEVDLVRLRELVLELFDGRGTFAGQVRILPFARMVRKGTVTFSAQDPYLMEMKPLLLKYPKGCSEEEADRVHQFGRLQGNMHYQIADRYKGAIWPRHFWNHNHGLVLCQKPIAANQSEADGGHFDEQGIQELSGILERNAGRATTYLKQVGVQRKVDLYDPAQDEVLLGLLARATRLYVLMCSTVRLWARDMGSVMLRLLVDTTITFSYLAKFGTADEFVAFQKYSDGKEKLLRLHLLEHYPNAKTIEGQSPDDIAEGLGGEFAAEMLDVDLAGWTKKSARDLAAASGLLDAYRLVYDPSSADVHGTWASIRRCNLVRCAEPLHRGHRLPTADSPPVSTKMQAYAQRVFETCIERGIEAIGLPLLPEPLEEIREHMTGVEQPD